ncbi:hypothetical protein PNEG_01107 [Pneumocystis murina B123]|uniref:Pru domain-containing protein n=1 Tax=Pneumocystis murina (strain B123) TaxID=1069680 RepID=M7NSY4_PNEMU|nr:hypothetical protein PNEG_01107 [Pneumocystis murina B123]EMR10392.1 hypothetical protein PNEG_01107 [Pneumocystis murina B123]
MSSMTTSFSEKTKDLKEEYIVKFKAGKMIRDGTTNIVKPDTRKGMIFIRIENDDLLHFYWKDRTTNIIEEDLIIFPGEAEFSCVKDSPSGRVFALHFKSSFQIFFFWMQDLNSNKDDYYVNKINEAIKNPVISESNEYNESPNVNDTQFFDNENDKCVKIASLDSGKENMETKEQNTLPSMTCKNRFSLSEYFLSLKSFLSNVHIPDDFPKESFILTDILTPSEAINLLQNKFIREALFPNLPPDILQNFELDEKSLENIISRECFQQSLRSLNYIISIGKLDAFISKFASDNFRKLDVFFRVIMSLIETIDQEMNISE